MDQPVIPHPRGGPMLALAGEATLPTLDVARLRAVLRLEGDRLTAVVRETGRLGMPVPGLRWNAGQVITHLGAALRAFGHAMHDAWCRDALAPAETAAVTSVEVDLLMRAAKADPRLAGTTTLVEHLAVVNDLAVREAGSDPEVAADELALAFATIDEILRRTGDLESPCATPWYGDGRTRTSITLMALAVSETLVHGRDFALAVGTDPAVSDRSAEVAAAVVWSRMLPMLLDSRRAAGADLTLRVVIRGSGRFVLRVTDGTATSLPDAGQRADATMSVAPAAALLLGLGRVGPVPLAVRGKLLAYGRRPWVASAVDRMFMTP